MENYKKKLELLRKADEAYYNTGTEIMSNKDYDELRDEVAKYEAQNPDSEKYTTGVGAVVVDNLPKYKHQYPALSLDKTKDVSEYVSKFKEHIEKSKTDNEYVVLMYKEDGSTVQAYYDKGVLQNLVTRGNGEIGSDISHNAKYINGLPLTIPYQGKLVTRGEALMSYEEFNRINALLPEEEQYKNPRNLANATISMLNGKEMRKRKINFAGFNLVYIEDENIVPFKNSFSARMHFLEDNGFKIVPMWVTKVDALEKSIETATRGVSEYEYPVDGLVTCMDDLQYTSRLKGTSHNPHIMAGYALKWSDVTEETILRKIEWSPSRTGLLNPVAVFDPVELEGTTVTRASLHNVSYLKEKDLRVGDRITVYKANMIIPQVDKNLSQEERLENGISDEMELEIICPVCKKRAVLKESNKTIVALCDNPSCASKEIKKFVHFCERDCMNIIGLSEERIAFLLAKGYLRELPDLYIMAEEYNKEGDITSFDTGDNLSEEEGWGEKSVQALAESISRSRTTSFVSFLHACGIPNVGKGQAKLLKAFLEENMQEDSRRRWEDKEDTYSLVDALVQEVWIGTDFTQIQGFGEVIGKSLTDWVKSYYFCEYLITHSGESEYTNILPFLMFTDEPAQKKESKIAGKTFVITGSLNTFKNRDEMVEKIESLGGKVSGSVSKNTFALVNNDTESTSGKNKKAKELGIPVISEAEFVSRYL